MIEAIRNLVALGVPLERAVDAATVVPAGILGLSDVGRIAPGCPGDIVVLDDSLGIDRVVVGGETYVAV